MGPLLFVPDRDTIENMHLYTRLRSQALPVTVAVVALALRLGYLAGVQRSSLRFLGSMDSDYYLAVAGRILSGEWFGSQVYFQSGFLYSYFLALFRLLFGPTLLPVQLAQILLDAAAAVFLAFLADRYFGRRATWVAGLGYALYAPFIAGSVQLLIDLPIVALFLSGLLLLEGSTLRSVAGGVLLGLVMVTRPYLLPLVPLVVLRPWFCGARGRGLLMRVLPPLLGTLLVISFVAARNRLIGHEWVLTNAGGGFVFYVGNNPQASGGFYVPTGLGVANDPYSYAESTRAYPSRELGHAASWREASSFWFEKGLAFWREEPAAALRLAFTKLRLCISNDEVGDNYDFIYLRNHLPFLRLPLTGFGVVFPFGLLGMFLAARRWRELLLPYAIVVLVVASQVAILVYTRHRYLLAAMLLLFAGVSIDRLLLWAKEGRWPRLAAAGGLLLVAGGVSFLPSGVPHRPWESSRNLAVELQRIGHTAEAETFYAEALRLYPDYADAALGYAGMLAGRGDVVRARACLAGMLDRVSTFPEGHAMMRELAAGMPPEGLAAAYASVRAGRGDALEYEALVTGYEAERRFLEARDLAEKGAKRFPGDYRLLGLWGRALDRLGDFREGARLYGDAARTGRNTGFWCSRQEVALGFEELMAKEVVAAGERFRKGISCNSASSEAHYGLGVVLTKEGRDKEAAAEFRMQRGCAVPGDRWVERGKEALRSLEIRGESSAVLPGAD